MFDNYLEIILLIKYPLIILFLCFIILSFYWNIIFNFFKLKTYNNVQRIHQNEVSRLGGSLIYIFFWIIYFFGFIDNPLFFYTLISAVPLVLIALKEDLFHNTSPQNRLFMMVLSCLIFLHISNINYPLIEFPYVGELISFYPVNIIFFTFSIIVVMNGMNLIDGVNGLFGLSAYFQLACLSYLAFLNYDFEFLRLSILFSIPLILFLIFNLAFGRIFIGDLGAYFFGFISSVMTIYIFGMHNNLPSLLAVLILFYPCMELLFSFIRKKLYEKKSPYLPDMKHIHSLIFKKFLSNNNVIFANLKTSLSLVFLWLTPFMICLFVPFNFIFILIFLIFNIIFYIFLYNYIK